VKVVSDAELGGVLADFARTGGVAVANVIIADFARRAAAEFAKDEQPIAPPSPREPSVIQSDALVLAAVGQQPSPNRPPPVPLAAHTLLWAVLKAQFARFGKWLRIIR
jgi:hypothetical protein